MPKLETAPLDPRKLPNVSSKYGAPMGRTSDRVPHCLEEWEDAGVVPRGVRVARVPFVDGDYDTGGAYWGGGRGVDPVWLIQWRTKDFPVFRDEPDVIGKWCRAYIRGSSRRTLVAELGIPSNLLARA